MTATTSLNNDLFIMPYKEPKRIEIVLHNIEAKDLSDINISFADDTQYKTETIRGEDGSYKYVAEPVTKKHDDQIPGQMSINDYKENDYGA